MRLDAGLLTSRPISSFGTSELDATLNAHGLYHRFQFVLRLSPRVHAEISNLEPGIHSSGTLTFDQVQAFSTYLHETIHWWQHIGTTCGFIRSLSYPIQTHRNHRPLTALLERAGFKKSIRQLAQSLPSSSEPGTPAGLANTIINNHFDIASFRALTDDRKLATVMVQDPLFESVGHSFEITYGNVALGLAETCDPEFSAIPDPRLWESHFRALRQEEDSGFLRGSPVGLWPVSARAIFEGQACLSQLQYLSIGSGGRLDWDQFRELGMFHGIYTEAFEVFLRLTELDPPPSVDHPTVALFLVVCDMAANPGSGFPNDPAPHYATFIADTDPGARFAAICRIICLACPHVGGSIQEYSRSEYKQVTEEIARALLIDSPLAIAATCSAWAEPGGQLARLMVEYETFDYEAKNLPLRVLFSHFLAFMRDKHSAPEFFCWPGAWMAGQRADRESQILFDRHSALFMDKEDDDGIFPRIYNDRDPGLVQQTFNAFYGANLVYDLTNQWIEQPGPFVYDHRWLTQAYSRDEIKDFADREFLNAYGFHPREVRLL